MAEGTSGFSSVTDTNVVLDPWIVKSVRALSRSKASPERGHPITRALDDTNTRWKASVWTFIFRVHRQKRAYGQVIESIGKSEHIGFAPIRKEIRLGEG